jgi:hypothetical protein
MEKNISEIRENIAKIRLGKNWARICLIGGTIAGIVMYVLSMQMCGLMDCGARIEKNTLLSVILFFSSCLFFGVAVLGIYTLLDATTVDFKEEIDEAEKEYEEYNGTKCP